MGDITIVILSFEGPDLYSRAGGLASRVTELSTELAGSGIETHLFFVGDPNLPGHETTSKGLLHLHRWCQWISRYHPRSVYDGEEQKLYDWDRSLPSWLEREILGPCVADGKKVVIMAEEWQTANTAIVLHDIIARHGWQDKVHILWNANNTFSFNRIDWGALKRSATITTVSRYMKQLMWVCGVDPRVIPNGISAAWFEPAGPEANAAMNRLCSGRLGLVKVARWDPDKRWIMAIDAVHQLKLLGLRPLLLARGGPEGQKKEVLDHAGNIGLKTASVDWRGPGPDVLIGAIRPALDADVIELQGYLSMVQRKLLYRNADAVLANSGREPFGLVGLETMAVGGIAFLGCTGEEYATSGHDAVTIQTNDPREIVHHAIYMHQRGASTEALRMRKEASRTATRYTWKNVIKRILLPLLEEIGIKRIGDNAALEYVRIDNTQSFTSPIIIKHIVPKRVGHVRRTLKIPSQ